MRETKVLLKIIKSFLENIQTYMDDDIDEEKLYKIAKNNKVSNFLQDWAQKNCKSEHIQKMILSDYNTQIIKDTNETIELEKILEQFEKAGIQTLVVKGAIMKEIYPQPYMRQMVDIDMMAHKKDFKIASQIMKNLGYSQFYNYEKHLIFQKKPFMLIELHRKLLLKKDKGHEYFENIWSSCEPYKNYQNVVQLNREDAYIFCILHLMIHFKLTGIHIRDILDIYLYHETYKNSFDFAKLEETFEKLGMTKFEKNMKEIAYKWFGGEEITEFSEVEKFILKGTSLNNDVNYHIAENQGKSNYTLRLFFPEFKIMKEKYPVLKKAPVLLPATWVARIFKDIFSKETTVKARVHKLKLIQEANSEEIEEIKNIYQKLGIMERK